MHDLWVALSHNLRALLDTHPLVVIAAVLFFEELGIPSPIPGDVLMLLAGARARQGAYPLWVVLLIQEAVTLAGTSGLFAFSRRFGRSFVTRYGWLLHLGPEQLARAEEAIGRSGGRAVVLGRILPGLRIATPIAAGALGLSFRTFLPAIAAGSALYLGFFTLVGYFAGPAVLALLERVSLPTSALASLAAVAFFFYMVRRLKRELPLFARGGQGHAVAARLDGLIAGVVALLLTNGIVGIVSFFLRLLGHPIPLVAAELGTGLRLLLGWPAFLLIASLLGAFDEQIGAERLAPIPRISLTAGLPLALTLLLAVPLSTSLAVSGGAVLLAIEVVRWLAFGVVLSELLPLDAEIHQLRPAVE